MGLVQIQEIAGCGVIYFGVTERWSVAYAVKVVVVTIQTVPAGPQLVVHARSHLVGYTAALANIARISHVEDPVGRSVPHVGGGAATARSHVRRGTSEVRETR